MSTQQSENRLKLAIQKSGRLADESVQLLAKCGISLSKSRDQLFCRAQNFPLDVFFVRDDDIPAFVASNACQIGIVGQNVLREEQLSYHSQKIRDLNTLMTLGFGKCRLSLAAPHDMPYAGPQGLEGKTIATTYEGILADFLARQNITAQIVTMKGAVEIAPRIRMADMVCDLVSTGATLAANGLQEVETVFRSEAVLIANQDANAAQQALCDRLMLRFQGVLRAAASKYIMLHCPVAALDRITAMLPGSDAPTIVPLQGRDDTVALHAVCEEGVFWETMEDLRAGGATDILVLPIEKMLQ